MLCVCVCVREREILKLEKNALTQLYDITEYYY